MTKYLVVGNWVDVDRALKINNDRVRYKSIEMLMGRTVMWAMPIVCCPGDRSIGWTVVIELATDLNFQP